MLGQTPPARQGSGGDMHTAPAWNNVIAGGRVLSGGQLTELDDGVPRVKAGGHARSEGQ